MSSHDLVPDDEAASEGKRLTGWKVLAILVGFFGVIFSVNGYMAYSAISTFSGEVDAHPYEHGIAYNHDIANAREQASRGWKVEVSLERLASGETRILVLARDAGGVDISGADARGQSRLSRGQEAGCGGEAAGDRAWALRGPCPARAGRA